MGDQHLAHLDLQTCHLLPSFSGVLSMAVSTDHKCHSSCRSYKATSQMSLLKPIQQCYNVRGKNFNYTFWTHVTRSWNISLCAKVLNCCNCIELNIANCNCLIHFQTWCIIQQKWHHNINKWIITWLSIKIVMHPLHCSKPFESSF